MISNNLYIWYQRTKLPKGYLYNDDILLKSKFYSKRPQTIHVGDENWTMFNHYDMNFPPNDLSFAFPSEMYLVVTKKKYKEIIFDYLEYPHYVKLISEFFFTFLKENGLDESYYETAKLNIVDLNGTLMTGSKYYALRFGKFDDTLFNFPPETRKRAAGLRDEFLYPDMEIITELNNKNIFVLQSFCYVNCLILNEKVMNYAIDNFYYEIYKTKDFPFVFNNQYKWDILPFNNELKVKK